MDKNLLLLVAHLVSLNNDLSEKDKKILKGLYNDWTKTFGNYRADFSTKTVDESLGLFDFVLRHRVDCNYSNAILTKVIEKLLAEKSKE